MKVNMNQELMPNSNKAILSSLNRERDKKINRLYWILNVTMYVSRRTTRKRLLPKVMLCIVRHCYSYINNGMYCNKGQINSMDHFQSFVRSSFCLWSFLGCDGGGEEKIHYVYFGYCMLGKYGFDRLIQSSQMFNLFMICPVCCWQSTASSDNCFVDS